MKQLVSLASRGTAWVWALGALVSIGITVPVGAILWLVLLSGDQVHYVDLLGLLGILGISVTGGAGCFAIGLNRVFRLRELKTRLADEIRASEERMRIAHLGTGAGTWERNSETGALTWSKELFQLYGRDPSLGVPSVEEWREMVHPNDRVKCPWIAPDLFDRSTSFTTDFRVRVDGEFRSISCRGSSLVEAGVRRRIVGMDLDVTSENRVREEMTMLYALLSDETVSIRRDRERIFEMTADMLAVGRADGTLVSVNPAWTKALGYSEEELLALNFRDLIVEVSDELEEQVRSQMKAHRTVTEIVLQMRAKDGSSRWVDWTMSPDGLSDEDGRIFAVGRDVTEQRLAQQRLLEVEGQMHQMHKLETIGKMTGGVAHDFNNLLTPIVGYLDVLQRRFRDDEKALRMINAALQSAERGRVLVSRLLTFARRQHLQAVVLDFGELVLGTGELLSRSVGTGIAVDIQVAEALPAVKIDPNQMELALLNLAVNARDAMPEGGKLLIEVGCAHVSQAPKHLALEADDFVTLTVTDNGIGMDKATLHRAVEPFYSTKEKGKGTGLGLSMVHGLAAQSGGALVLESEFGVGTKATIWLPRAEEVAPAAKCETNVVMFGRETRTLKILVVDDEPLVRHGIVDMLEEMGHQVLEVSSGHEALKVLNDHPEIELLLTDYSMPMMTGVELIHKAREVRPNLPALVVSGYSDAERFDSPDMLRLSKPFTVTRLAGAVAEAATLISNDQEAIASVA